MTDDLRGTAWNTDLSAIGRIRRGEQFVRPAEFHSAKSEAAENISAGCTGHRPVFRCKE
jgi:hypothetical protein